MFSALASCTVAAWLYSAGALIPALIATAIALSLFVLTHEHG